MEEFVQIKLSTYEGFKKSIIEKEIEINELKVMCQKESDEKEILNNDVMMFIESIAEKNYKHSIWPDNQGVVRMFGSDRETYVELYGEKITDLLEKSMSKKYSEKNQKI